MCVFVHGVNVWKCGSVLVCAHLSVEEDVYSDINSLSALRHLYLVKSSRACFLLPQQS